MLNIGEKVQYLGNGVCEIIDIKEINFDSDKQNYYILKPVSAGYNTFYIPVNNEKLTSKLRKILTLSEVEEIIKSMPESDYQWIDDDVLRKEKYKKIIADGDHREIVKVIKAIHFHKQELTAMGKKPHIVDEVMLKDAENMLYDEFAAVLSIKKDEVLPYIIKSIEQ